MKKALEDVHHKLGLRPLSLVALKQRSQFQRLFKFYSYKYIIIY